MPVARRLPARVVADDQAAVEAIEDDRPGDADRPGTDHRLELHELIRGAAHEHVEPGPHDARELQVRDHPVGDHARAIARQVDPRDGDLLERTLGELLIEELGRGEEVAHAVGELVRTEDLRTVDGRRRSQGDGRHRAGPAGKRGHEARRGARLLHPATMVSWRPDATPLSKSAFTREKAGRRRAGGRGGVDIEARGQAKGQRELSLDILRHGRGHEGVESDAGLEPYQVHRPRNQPRRRSVVGREGIVPVVAPIIDDRFPRDPGKGISRDHLLQRNRARPFSVTPLLASRAGRSWTPS